MKNLPAAIKATNDHKIMATNVELDAKVLVVLGRRDIGNILPVPK